MSPELLAFLVSSALKLPALARELRGLARQNDVTDEQWDDLERILKTDPASYFTTNNS